MTDSIDILKSELSELLSSDRERLDEITRSRASQQRIDDYTLLLRDVLAKSSLCYLNGELSFFDGRSYVIVSCKDVADTMGNLLIENYIRVVRDTVGNNVLSLKEIDLVVIYSDVLNIFRNIHFVFLLLKALSAFAVLSISSTVAKLICTLT